MSKSLSKYIDNLKRLDNKKVIVTGANSGLGFEMSKIFVSKGAQLIMACRNTERAEKAKEQILLEYPNAKIILIQYDQSDAGSIIQFAETIIKDFSDFYALVLNAGILKPEKELKSKHGFTLTFGTNYFGTLLLLDKLQNIIKETNTEKRIVIHGSCVMYNCKFKSIEKSLLNEDMNTYKQYQLSKLAEANIYHYLVCKNNNENVKYLLGEPGIAKSNITRYYTLFINKVWHKIVGLIFNSTIKGCLSCCKLVCDEIDNGDYYRPRGPFGFNGLPKKVKFKDRLVLDNLIEESREVMYAKIN